MNTNISLLDEDVCDQVYAELFQRASTGDVKYPAVHQASPPCQSILSALIERLGEDEARQTIERVFDDLVRLLGYLSLVESELSREGSLQDAPQIFTLVEGEAYALLNFIETQALQAEGLGARAADVLDATSYAIRLELKRVSESDLEGLCDARQQSLVRAAVEHAHGVLCNCFQQSVIALARVFDPTLDGAQLFDDFQIRFRQSLTLYEDLRALGREVRRAETEADSYPVEHLMERLDDFRDGSMRYLMFKDWEGYERFVEKVRDAGGAAARAAVLHRLGCYLETLIGHVRMRAVLADYPFNISTGAEEI
ncbi:MAG: hypothetical protein ACRD68_14175 [Pyrinomonadaceae bacterium]